MKAFTDSFFSVFLRYKELYKKRNKCYINYAEEYNEFVINNFWYLNYFYTELLVSIKDDSAFEKVIKNYFYFNPDICRQYLNSNDRTDVEFVRNYIKLDFEFLKKLYDDLILYHYTNFDSLGKIIEGHNLKFSNITLKSNDNTEGAYLDKYFDKYHSKFFNKVDDLKNNQDNYAFCLSSKKDDVAQWARYAGYDGACLVFSVKELFDYFSNYLIKYQGVFFITPLKYASFEKISKKDYVAELAFLNLTTEHQSLFNALRLMFKHQSFESEREYRLYFCLDKNNDNLNEIDILKKNFTDGSIMMEIAREKFTSIIPQIIFGPHSKERDRQNIIKKLKDKGFEKITCIKSDCPIKQDKKCSTVPAIDLLFE